MPKPAPERGDGGCGLPARRPLVAPWAPSRALRPAPRPAPPAQKGRHPDKLSQAQTHTLPAAGANFVSVQTDFGRPLGSSSGALLPGVAQAARGLDGPQQLRACKLPSPTHANTHILSPSLPLSLSSSLSSLHHLLSASASVWRSARSSPAQGLPPQRCPFSAAGLPPPCRLPVPVPAPVPLPLPLPLPLPIPLRRQSIPLPPPKKKTEREPQARVESRLPPAIPAPRLAASKTPPPMWAPPKEFPLFPLSHPDALRRRPTVSLDGPPPPAAVNPLPAAAVASRAQETELVTSAPAASPPAGTSLFLALSRPPRAPDQIPSSLTHCTTPIFAIPVSPEGFLHCPSMAIPLHRPPCRITVASTDHVGTNSQTCSSRHHLPEPTPSPPALMKSSCQNPQDLVL